MLVAWVVEQGVWATTSTSVGIRWWKKIFQWLVVTAFHGTSIVCVSLFLGWISISFMMHLLVSDLNRCAVFTVKLIDSKTCSWLLVTQCMFSYYYPAVLWEGWEIVPNVSVLKLRRPSLLCHWNHSLLVVRWDVSQECTHIQSCLDKYAMHTGLCLCSTQVISRKF